MTTNTLMKLADRLYAIIYDQYGMRDIAVIADELRTLATEEKHAHSEASIELSTRQAMVPCDCGCGRQCCAMCGVDLGFIQELSPPKERT